MCRKDCNLPLTVGFNTLLHSLKCSSCALLDTVFFLKLFLDHTMLQLIYGTSQFAWLQLCTSGKSVNHDQPGADLGVVKSVARLK